MKGSGGSTLFRLLLEMLREQAVRGTGTLRLDDLDCLPLEIKVIPGDFGSGVREIETPEMKSVGDLGMPVSDSYSFELSVSKVCVLEHLLSGHLQIFMRRLEDEFFAHELLHLLLVSTRNPVDFENPGPLLDF